LFDPALDAIAVKRAHGIERVEDHEIEGALQNFGLLQFSLASLGRAKEGITVRLRCPKEGGTRLAAPRPGLLMKTVTEPLAPVARADCQHLNKTIAGAASP
jgi:hypothetical protein